jgi:FPC/CPF motif-containing protein YcgG
VAGSGAGELAVCAHAAAARANTIATFRIFVIFASRWNYREITDREDIQKWGNHTFSSHE